MYSERRRGHRDPTSSAHFSTSPPPGLTHRSSRCLAGEWTPSWHPNCLDFFRPDALGICLWDTVVFAPGCSVRTGDHPFILDREWDPKTKMQIYFPLFQPLVLRTSYFLVKKGRKSLLWGEIFILKQVNMAIKKIQILCWFQIRRNIS